MSEDVIGEELGLNPRQIQFCREYIVDLNMTQAYIRAGYSEEGAGNNASRLMSDDRIRSLCAKFAQDRALRTQTDADTVVSQVARLAKSDIRKIVHKSGALKRIEELDDDTAAALQSVKVTKRLSGEVDEEGRPIYEDVVEYKLADKKGALDLLGKHMALWLDRIEHSGSVKLKHTDEEMDLEAATRVFEDNVKSLRD